MEITLDKIKDKFTNILRNELVTELEKSEELQEIHEHIEAIVNDIISQTNLIEFTSKNAFKVLPLFISNEEEFDSYFKYKSLIYTPIMSKINEIALDDLINIYKESFTDEIKLIINDPEYIRFRHIEGATENIMDKNQLEVLIENYMNIINDICMKYYSLGKS
jgi:hypothetical protein